MTLRTVERKYFDAKGRETNAKHGVLCVEHIMEDGVLVEEHSYTRSVGPKSTR